MTTLSMEPVQDRTPAFSLYLSDQPLGTPPAQVTAAGPIGAVNRTARAALEDAPVGSKMYAINGLAVTLQHQDGPKQHFFSTYSTQDAPGGLWTRHAWNMQGDGTVDHHTTEHARLHDCVSLLPAPHKGKADLRGWATGLPSTYAGMPVRYGSDTEPGTYPYLHVGHHELRHPRPGVTVRLITGTHERPAFDEYDEPRTVIDDAAVTVVEDADRFEPESRNNGGTLGAVAFVPNPKGILDALALAAQTALDTQR